MKDNCITLSFLRGKFPTYFLLALALILIVTGLLQGDFGDIRNRAINICLECIGIG